LVIFRAEGVVEIQIMCYRCPDVDVEVDVVAEVDVVSGEGAVEFDVVVSGQVEEVEG
jgi:hypothetical protein